jgi:hypothetical protein
MEHSDLPVFVAHPQCPPHLRQLVEDAVEAFDNAWLLPPQNEEVFTTAKECLARLQGFALSRGFAVVTRGSDKKRASFCVYTMVKKRRIGVSWSNTSRGILMITRRSLASVKEKILPRMLGAVPGKCIGV